MNMRYRRILGALTAAGLIAGSGVVAGSSARASMPTSAVRAALAETMELDGWPAALVAVRDEGDRVKTLASGVLELGETKKARAGDQVRIGSSTKTFTAVIVLQLVDEGLVSLDEPVETYLPGVVRHPDVTGAEITVRQLLQHTSGLPDMSGDIGQNLISWQHRYISPRASLDLAFTHPVENAPGEALSYSNANFILAGLLVETVAGRPFAEELERRLLEPLGLDDTYFPEQGEEEIRGKHPHSYIPLADPPTDYTVFDPSWAHAAGAMVSTAEDMTTFFSALAEGELLPASLLAEMQQTIPADSIWPGAAYGLGLIAFELSCGVTAWGHGGDAPGTVSRVAATEDGRAAAIVVTKNGTEAAAEQRLRDLVDTAICAL